VSSSISRQLVFWLAVPLMLLALCGALVHYFNNVAPGVISSDRRLKDAASALMARIEFANGRLSLSQRTSTGDRTPLSEGAAPSDRTATGDRTPLSNGAAASDRNAPPLPSPDSVAYAVRDSRGRLLIGNPAVPAVPMSDDTTQLLALSQMEHHSVRTLTTRFDTAGGVILITTADMRAPGEPAARLGLMSTLLWDFVQLDVTLVLVWVGIQLGLRPVKKLRNDIAERSPLDLRPIDEVSVPREIAPVVVTLNRLFTMLRSSVQSQKQFIANTAHQLRTPITGMQAQLDLLVAEPAAAPVKNRLLTLQEGIRQLAHSANQLLTLARADPAVNIAGKNQTVELHTLVGDVVAKFFDRALQANIDLGIDVKPVSMVADPALIDDLLSNLVDNALKYTPAGGSVTASAGAQNGKAFLAVEDTGPGIPEAERQRVRQRFYRLPNSPGHGSGLGLAIVDEIARLYGASVTIESGAGGRGTKVLLQFIDTPATHS
jgi:two-component system sensor histidine kinase TctE